MNLTQRMLEFQKKKPLIELDGKVHYKQTQFKYATLGQIIEKVIPVLLDLGVLVIQGIEDGCVYTLLTDGNNELKSIYRLPEINNPQELGKWITYVKRYQLCAMLAIVGEDDVDGQLAQRNKDRDAQEENNKEVRARIIMAIGKASSHAKMDEIEARIDAIGFDKDAEIQSLIMQKRDGL